MPVKLRLQRKGRKKSPFYHIVVADARSPRDGRFIEKIGTYNPMTKPATIELDRKKAYDWLLNGAQPTETVRAILRFKGVLYLKHLQQGVAKGSLTQEQADEKFTAWLDKKEARIAARFEQTKKEKEAFHARMAGFEKAAQVGFVSKEGEATSKEILGKEEAETETATATEVFGIASAVEEAQEATQVETVEEVVEAEAVTTEEDKPE
ncbi:MAG: 30S ribosomal protein S16 [Saprospiraceae bacterium]|nr:30S ribosomal protein S16 [Saprospiraceae bacterium]